MKGVTFGDFTNLYSLQKTLRFELRPIGADGKELKEEQAKIIFENIIVQDKKIKEAYDALKPIMDKIHEQVITDSLTSDEAKKIDFSVYFEEYAKGKEKKMESAEKSLRTKVGETFIIAANSIYEKAGNITDEKGKERAIFSDKEKGLKCLTASGILKYIKKYIGEFENEEQKQNELLNHISNLKGFFTYFAGYNQNRENYYEIKAEKSTAVATRIVHENLPKFCDNRIQFLSRRDDYLGAKRYLEEVGRETTIKDAESNVMIEASHIDGNLFDISYFNKCLSQSGIDGYNRIIGHYNSLINLYNQAKKSSNKEFKKIPHFKILYKQIGCGEKSERFKQIADDKELKQTIEQISNAGKKYFEKSTDENQVTIHTFIEWLKQTEDWDGIYWSKAAIDKVSNKYLANWYEIKNRIQDILQSKDKARKDLLKSVASYDKKREEQLKLNDAVELSGLFEILNQDKEPGWSKNFFKESVLEEYQSLIDESMTPSQNLINMICRDIENLAKAFCEKSEDILKKEDYENENNILIIKEWLDTAKQVLWPIKYFEVKESKVKGDSINPELTNMLTALLRADDADWFNWYDLVRNRLTKKPQDDAKKNKLKLNFGSSSFLDGLSQDFDAKAGLIFEKDSLYYLAINYNLSKEDIKEIKKINGEVATRIIIDFQKPDSKNTPRLFIRSKGDDFAPAVEKYRLPIDDIIDIYDNGKFKTEYRKTNEREFTDSLRKMIDYFKEGFSKHNSYKHYNFAWKETSEYKDISEFYHDTEISCYQIKKENISWGKLLKSIDDRKVFLFQIYNKDFSKKKKTSGKDNIHTYYWKSLFSQNAVNKFGTQGAKIFFREKSIDYVPKCDDTGREMGHHYNALKDKFEYPIVSDRRFTTNKFLFHCPIILNYKLNGTRNENEIINEKFGKASDIQFLGIDRGEKHLIYYSLIDINGKIIEQGDFDTINGKNYLKEINDAAKKRKERQENWQQKGNISNLKDGYISLVVHEIIEKMKDKEGNFKPTFIVLEDLNTGFKRSRQKFEQQVYQKFELALAKKLNYLVDKSVTDPSKIGSVAKALQLAPPVANYQDIENKKQVGIMFYTRPNYTSVTDPATGWRKTIYLQKGNEKEIREQILKYFSEIAVDEHGDYFFEYTDAGTNKTWRLWSGKNGKSLERYRFRRGNAHAEGIIESYDIKDRLDKLFANNFNKNQSLKSQIKQGIELNKINGNIAWESLRFVIDLIQQIRNSGANKGQDDNFLLSPVRNKHGEHFDSRKTDSTLPTNGDANGAYNIARKGLIMFEHIKQWQAMSDTEQKGNALNLFISDEEWDLWLSNKNLWREKVQNFAIRQQNKTKEKIEIR